MAPSVAVSKYWGKGTEDDHTPQRVSRPHRLVTRLSRKSSIPVKTILTVQLCGLFFCYVTVHKENILSFVCATLKLYIYIFISNKHPLLQDLSVEICTLLIKLVAVRLHRSVFGVFNLQLGPTFPH